MIVLGGWAVVASSTRAQEVAATETLDIARTRPKPISSVDASTLRSAIAFGQMSRKSFQILNEEPDGATASRISFDKIQHVTFGFLFTVGYQYTFVNKLHWSENSALPASVAATAVVSVSKEVYDWKRGSRREFSRGDLVADAVGILLATGLILL